MKIKILYFTLIVAVFSSCNQTNFDPIPKEQLMGTKWESTTTIQNILDTYLTKNDQYTDTVTKTAGLFTADLIPSSPDLVINGIITSSDIEGNIYKYITVQEEGANARAIKISIDAGSLSGIWPLGQRVSVRVNGLYIGQYAQSPQLGIRYENPTKYKEDTVKHIKYYRIEPGRMPLSIALNHISAYEMPHPEAVLPDTMTIAQIKAAGTAVYNKLVCIKNAFFTGRGAYNGQPTLISDEQMIFAPSTNGVGYPQSREIQDPTGSIFVSTSEYAKFAGKKIPPSSFVGDITAIVGWYNDKDVTLNKSKTYHQLTLRSIKDLGKGFEKYLSSY